MLEGSCHCGALTVSLSTKKAPTELPVRVCGCTFCLKHRPLYTSDPTGTLTFRAREADVVRYRFGQLRQADFLLCARCGVFMGAMTLEAPWLGVVNLCVLERANDFTATPTRFEAYDTENAAERSARRHRAWTPAVFETR